MKKYAGEEFLNRLYKDLVHSDEVKHTAKGANKNEDLAIYLERLERITKQARDKDKVDFLKYFYYKKYIIKEDEVPESYFETLAQIGLERGHGHIKYDDNARQQEIISIISEQKASLDRWLDYFISEETNYYPMWFKYYVFQNVMKIGFYDKEKNEFTKRGKGTVKPFIEINREAIAILYDELCKYLNKQELTDEQLEQLIKNGSFNRVYSYITRKLDKVNKISSTSNEGIWKKYEQGSNPEILFNDIHGKGTGWCTAGGLETATSHLDGGDFYVYFTKDDNEEYTNPRIAIRMEYGRIAEVRGVAEHQNLENEMESVVEEKLNEFPDKDEYKKKVSDMKELTEIYNKYKNKEELTKEELSFLYEIDSKIIGFGYEKDPRIEEIKNKRSIKKDLPIMFDLKPDEITTNTLGVLLGNKKLCYGHLNYNGIIKKLKGVKLPEIIIGNLDLSDLITAKNVVLPKEISGNLDLRGLTNAKGLVLPQKINGNLDLRGLTNAEGLVLSQKMNVNLNLNGLTSAEGLVLPKVINGSLSLDSLTNAGGLVLPDEIVGWLSLAGLTSAEGLVLPQKMNGDLNLEGLTSSKGLVLPDEIGCRLSLAGLTSAEGLALPKKVNGDLYLNSLTDPEGIMLPKNEQGEFYVPGFNLICSFTKEQLIEASKRTEARKNEPRIFEDTNNSLGSKK